MQNHLVSNSNKTKTRVTIIIYDIHVFHNRKTIYLNYCIEYRWWKWNKHFYPSAAAFDPTAKRKRLTECYGAKSAWRETRVFGGIGLFVLSPLLSPWYITSLYIERNPGHLRKAQSNHNKPYPILSLIDANLILSLNWSNPSNWSCGPWAPNWCPITPNEQSQFLQQLDNNSPGYACSASSAAAWLAGSAPSIITCPPRSKSSLYNFANSAGDLSDSKFVTSSMPSLDESRRVEPTICLTFPWKFKNISHKINGTFTATGVRCLNSDLRWLLIATIR